MAARIDHDDHHIVPHLFRSGLQEPFSNKTYHDNDNDHSINILDAQGDDHRNRSNFDSEKNLGDNLEPVLELQDDSDSDKEFEVANDQQGVFDDMNVVKDDIIA